MNIGGYIVQVGSNTVVSLSKEDRAMAKALGVSVLVYAKFKYSATGQGVLINTEPNPEATGSNSTQDDLEYYKAITDDR